MQIFSPIQPILFTKWELKELNAKENISYGMIL